MWTLIVACTGIALFYIDSKVNAGLTAEPVRSQVSEADAVKNESSTQRTDR